MKGYENILLVNPMQNSPIEHEMYPSGALILLGTMLHNKGYKVKIVHMLADRVGPSQLGDIVSSFKPDIVGITMSTFQTKSAREVSKIVKEVNRNILVVVGGPHASALKLRIFNDFPHVDVAVIGEGEFTFMEIVEGKHFDEIQGICYEHKMNSPRPLAENLDHIPLPNLDLVDISRFVGAVPVGALPTAFIMASRGCPFHCTFCNKSVWGNTARFRRPELVIEEVKWLHQRGGAREIFFQDDTFNLNREWAEQILRLIIDNGLNRHIVYKAPFRANRHLVDEELLRLAKAAGFWLIFYGVESGNQGMLTRMKKGLTIDEIRRAFKLTHRAGLQTYASFIIGMPGETRGTVMDTINLRRVLRPCHGGGSPAIPFPGTELERIVIEKNHLLTRDYDEYRPDKLIVRTDGLTKQDLEHYARVVNGMVGGGRERKILANTWKALGIIGDSLRHRGSLVRRIATVRGLVMSFLLGWFRKTKVSTEV